MNSKAISCPSTSEDPIKTISFKGPEGATEDLAEDLANPETKGDKRSNKKKKKSKTDRLRNIRNNSIRTEEDR